MNHRTAAAAARDAASTAPAVPAEIKDAMVHLVGLAYRQGFGDGCLVPGCGESPADVEAASDALLGLIAALAK